MPWTGESFAHHNHGLSPSQSLHAAHIANAILRRGAPESEAIATANKMMMPHRDAGGMTPATPGFAPNNTNQQPIVQNYIQRFSSLPSEQLQELIPRLDPALASIATRILQSKRIVPQQGAQQQPTSAMPQFGVPAQGQARGGMIRRAAGGYSPSGLGSGSAVTTGGNGSGFDPAWVAAHTGATTGGMSQGYSPTYLGSGIHPATQALPNVGGGTPALLNQQQKMQQYLADNGTVNGTGQSTARTLGTGINASTGMGSSQTGNAALDNYLNATQAGASYKPPVGYVAPAAVTTPAVTTPATGLLANGEIDTTGNDPAYNSPALGKRGGRMESHGGMKPREDTVPILAAGGEFTISPQFVARLGDGDIRLGHKRLDEWVVAKRKEIIKEMSKLRGPVKS